MNAPRSTAAASFSKPAVPKATDPSVLTVWPECRVATSMTTVRTAIARALAIANTLVLLPMLAVS
jgi:hypothetical protein